MDNLYKRYDQINEFINGVATVIKNNLYGVIVYGGLEIIAPKYDYISPFKDGYATVIKNGHCLYIDLSENFYAKYGEEFVILPSKAIYDELRDFHYGLACFRIGNNWGVINTQGQEIFSPQFYYISDFNHSVALIKKTFSSCWGFINKNGFISEETYEEALLTEEGNLIVIIYEYTWGNGRLIDGMDKKRVVLINHEGNQIILTDREPIVLPDWIHYARNPQNGLICAQNMDGEWGVLNTSCEIVVPFQYLYILDFCEQRTFAKTKDNKILLLSDSGTIISELPEGYVNAETFFNRVAKIYKNQLIGLIDREGHIILDAICNNISYCGNSEYELSKKFINRKIMKGYFNSTNKRTVLPFYDKIIKIWNEGAIVSVDIIEECTIDYVGRPIVKDNNIPVKLPLWVVAAKIVEDKYIICLSNGLKWGITDKLGNVICEPIFDSIISYDDSIVVGMCFKEIMNAWGSWSGYYDELYGAYNLDNRSLLKPELNYAPKWEKHFYKIEDKKKFGIINSRGKFICKPIYDEVRWESNYFIVGKFRESWSSEKKYGILDNNGNDILSVHYEQVSVIADNIFKVKYEGCWFLYEQSGKLNNLGFSKIGSLNEDLVIPVEYLNKTGYVNQRGDLMIRDNNGIFVALPKKFEWGNDFVDGYATVWIDNCENTINSDLKLIVKTDEYTLYLPDFVHHVEKIIGDKIIVVSNNKRRGLIHKDGTIILKPIYESVELIGDRNYIVSILKNDEGLTNKLYGVIDEHMKIIIDFEYNYLSLYTGHVPTPYKRGFYYEDEEYPIPRVYKMNKSHYLLGQKAVIINDNSSLSKRLRYGLIDISGRVRLPFKYLNIIQSKRVLFIQDEYTKWGIFNLKLQQICDFKYHGIRDITDKYFKVVVETREEKHILNHWSSPDIEVSYVDKYGIIDYHGKEIIPPTHKSIDVTKKKGYYILRIDGYESRWSKEFTQLF